MLNFKRIIEAMIIQNSVHLRLCCIDLLPWHLKCTDGMGLESVEITVVGLIMFYVVC
jgi:hypothetical protein